MSFPRRATVVLIVGVVIGAMSPVLLRAQPVAPGAPSSSVEKMSLPPVPFAKSPVDVFRELLAMNPVERRNSLTNRPPEIRARILDKLKEYEALDPNERELRLRATELRWYLEPLMRSAPGNRDAQLVAIPPDIRRLVEDRIMQWDLLPPPMQQELLDNEDALQLFTHVDGRQRAPSPPNPITLNQYGLDTNLARWNALPEEKRQVLTAQFAQFFDLTQAEKTKTLNTLSEAERTQMEKTLEAFEKLPRAQRLQCIRSFEKFSEMSALEKVEFLKNAERWSQMKPAERETWRKLVARVPQWPPLPPGLDQPGSPPLPQTIRQKIRALPLWRRM